MTTRLLLDWTCVNPGAPTGAARYALALARSLAATDLRVTVCSFPDEPPAPLPAGFDYRAVPMRRYLGPVAREEARVRAAAHWAHEFDLVHWTLDPAPPAPGRPTVLTLFDLARRAGAFTQTQRPSLRSRGRTRRRYGLARRMDVLVATTHAAASDIVHDLPFPAERVVVAPIPPDPIFTPGAPDADVLRRLDLNGRAFALFVGQLGRQKNEDGLAAAFVAAKSDGLVSSDVRLALAGDDAQCPAALRRLAGGRDDIHILGPVDDAALLTLYRGARLAALPSFFEGYGLPVVEAMACGTPCVVSDTTSLPELGGDAALRVDPTSRVSIADALARLFNDHALHAELSARGLARSRVFSDTTMAERHVEAYGLARARHG